MGRLLWPEEVAALLGWKNPHQVSWQLSRTRRRMAQGKSDSSDLPLPADNVTRRVPTRTPGELRTVRSHRWDEDAIRHWMEHRGDDRQVTRDEAGKFTERAG